MTNFDKFAQAYREELPKHVMLDCGWYPGRTSVVADRMIAAFKNGSFNKDNHAIKAVCKALGIKFTYRDIKAFLAS